MSGHVPCPACRRHVRVDEPRCPFCASALSSERTPVPHARRRLARGAAFVFASTLASASGGALVGCGGDVEDPAPARTDAGADAKGDGATADGGDTGSATDTGLEDTGPEDTGTVAPPYGIPPEDGGGGMADYGAPPPPDDAGA